MEANYSGTGWNGSSIADSGEGIILKRNFLHDLPVDTNTSKDWNHSRRYGIGQSDFPYIKLFCTGEIRTFVSPDCSYETIIRELRKANESIYFNIYEFTNPFLCDALVAALKRNVSINLFVEGGPIGGIDDREQYILCRIANHGGNVRFIVNDPENRVYDRYRFNHAKYLVIDHSTVIIKSCNWAKTGIPIHPTFGNREWGIIVKNKDLAHYFINVFLEDWNPQICDSYTLDKMGFSIPSDFFLDETIYKGSYTPQFTSYHYQGNFTAIPVLSPDTSEQIISDLIDSASTSILLEQLYVYKDWEKRINPFVEKLVEKSCLGVEVKVILNYNPAYEPTNEQINITRQYLQDYGIEVKFLYTNWSYFTNIHNKGMIVDNKSVLISSINWNENSVRNNREVGVIIESEEIARYYADVFYYDWHLSPPESQEAAFNLAEYKNPFLIILLYCMTCMIILRDWRKRQW